MSWRWYLDWSNNYYTLAELYVVDHEHNRRLENSGEFRTQSDAQHPVTDYNYIPACSYGAICNGSWIDWRTDTSSTLSLSSFSSNVVTVMIRAVDYWIADTTGLEVDYIKVLDSNNNVLHTYDFTYYENVFMEKTSGYYDYGLLRKPSFVHWGTQDYLDDSGGYDEWWASGAISDYICDLFSATNKYPYLENYWDSTQPNDVYSSAQYSETYYDYSIIFYKGHFWLTGQQGICGNPTCTFYHRGVVDNEGYSVQPVGVIMDYWLHYYVNEGKDDGNKWRGTHDFVFLWACMHGDSSWLGDIEDHSWGLASSWMDIEDASSNLGLEGSAGADHVFIGFDYVSPWYTQDAEQSPFNYGHFIYWFWDYALTPGYTIEEALNDASWDANGCSYLSSELRNNVLVWNPQIGDYSNSRMRVYGDWSYQIPR
ncbi:MAG: hypothetical protein NWE95_06215 [Candidatus Bathyarchaeota archaeon]|nr:hypothetical protein [Candidatus Bathyarchaeota archaeon]